MAAEAVVKSDHLKKVELLKEISQLNIKVQNYEKEKSTHIYNKHGEFYKEFTHLQEMDMKMLRERKIEKGKLQQQLSGIKTKVGKFHRELQNVKPTPEFVEKLKVIMEEIEEKISSFKDQQRQLYEEIMKEERITSQEITAIEKKIEMWAQQGATAAGLAGAKSKPVAVAGNRDITKNLPPEVAAFERFLEQSGGIKAGWDEYDHGAFLRYRVKHKGRMTFIRELIPALPTRTEQEIIDHERWYQQYLELNEDKKEAIQKWKEKKEVEKETVLAQAEQNENDSFDDERREKEEHLKEVIEQEKLQRKMMLGKWKVEKELEKAEEEERRLREQLEKARKRDQEKLRKEEQRRKVEEYKQRREEEKQRKELEDAIKEQMELEAKKERANQNIVKFQTRDLQSVNKKLEKDKARELEAKQKEERLRRLKGQVGVHVERDPSRLLQPTQGWMERQKDPGSPGGQVLHMPHRAIPSWRQGML